MAEPESVRDAALSRAVLLILKLRGMVFAANVREVHARRRHLQAHSIHGVGDDLRHREIAEPLVVRGDDVPGRMLCARQRHGILVRTQILRP